MNDTTRIGGNREDATAFAGHDPESGILSRLREWTDVAPPLRLTRVLRMAGSPVLMIAAWIVCGVSLWLSRAMLAAELGDVIRGVVWAAVAITLWIPLAAVLFRQGALLTAGRDMESIRDLLRRIVRRRWQVLIVVSTAALIVGFLFLCAAAIFAIAHWFDFGGWAILLQIPLTLVGLALLLPASLLGAAGLVATPMALAAIVNESDPDPLDSLSRGYEYVFRGWLPLLGLTLITALLTASILPLALAVTRFGAAMIHLLVVWIGDSSAAVITKDALAVLPVAAAIVVAGGCTGGVYLLLRKVTGGQEVEDLWSGEPKAETPMPVIRGGETSAAAD